MEQEHPLETDWFKMPSSLFLTMLILRYGKGWIIFSLSFFLIGLVAGIFYDHRFAIIALMVIFLLLPLEMLFLYLYYGFLPSCYFNVTQHKISIRSMEIVVSMKWSVKRNEDDADADENGEDITRSITFKKHLYRKISVLKNSVIFYSVSDKGFLWLPESAFDDEYRFVEFVKSINK